jgi:hypothetical protein
MRNTVCKLAAVAVAVLWHSIVLGAPVLQSGDRWPQNSARAVAVDVAGGHVFLGRGNVLTVLDSNLGFVGSKDMAGEILGIFYAANFVYAAMGAGGLKIVDVSNPAAPAVLANAYTPSDGSGIASVFVSEPYAYAASLNRFTVIDVSNPANPSEAGAITLPGLLVYSINLFVSGTVAAVADQVNGLHLIDVHNPQAPVWKSVTTIAGAWDVFVSGDYAYVTASAGGMTIVNFDIANLSNTNILGTFAPADSNFLGLIVAGNAAYVADQNNGLREVNVADKANPGQVQTFAGTRGAYSVALSGSDLWVCDFVQGLQKIGSGNAQYNPPSDAADIFLDGDFYLYIVDSTAGSGDGTEGLRILDAFNLGNLVFKGFVATPGQASAVFVSGDYAYVADGTSGLQIIAVADKTSPAIVGALDTPGTAQDVFVSGNYAYVADGANGLRIIDITTKDNPQATGSYDTDGTANAVFVSGNYAYVADGASGLQIINVTDKANPTRAGFIDTAGTAFDLVVSGSYAYIADGAGGLKIINISSPASPVNVGSYDTDGTAMGVSLAGNYVRLADGSNGLVTLDISNPAVPTRVAAWSTSTNGNALKIVSVNEYAFMAEGLAGTVVYKLSDEEPFIPVPFNPPASSSCFIDTLAGTN